MLQTECVLRTIIAFVTQCTLESQDRFNGMMTLSPVTDKQINCDLWTYEVQISKSLCLWQCSIFSVPTVNDQWLKTTTHALAIIAIPSLAGPGLDCRLPRSPSVRKWTTELFIGVSTGNSKSTGTSSVHFVVWSSTSLTSGIGTASSNAIRFKINHSQIVQDAVIIVSVFSLFLTNSNNKHSY